ncbi:hypothetical protein PPSIR1_41054 [Plesiocystis pacifica SIR-1]|uniref:Uncharacterized protein n=1 Tax=Plesiocystis pacifica SIR-1 TaxID=391625 RepID=A6GG19_9BACT|nr:hypothetical protein [Plesiocystis pacifica]EDM75206.1 hypothetical protein PPSIR1_41054 [Plesiocystis pacifica SIR-1]
MVDIDISKKTFVPFLACGLISGLAITAPGCDVAEDLAKQCGLVCPDNGIAEGNASISGVVSIDAFFGAVIAVRDAAATVSGNVRGELEGIAASLEIEGYQELSFDELALAVQGGLQAKFEANLEGGLTISFEPPRCQANVDIAVQAAAECDVDVDPGMIEVQCMGSCEVSAEVAAQCEAEGTLECTGKAPDFSCSGTCSGSCQLDVAAGCSGTCSGTCSGECSACVGGECETDGMGNITNCAGSCSANCEGTCELEAGGECGGRCEGECTYMPAEGGCEAGATAKCDVSAMADVECQGGCEGDVQPPEVSAECQASVEAKAEASVECTPPSLSVEFQFAAGLDADAQAEFKIWLEGFKTRFAAMAAASAKLDGVSVALEGLLSASVDLIPNVIADLEAEGGLDLSATIGLSCALTEAEFVGEALAGATTDVTGSLSAFTMISGSVSGG